MKFVGERPGRATPGVDECRCGCEATSYELQAGGRQALPPWSREGMGGGRGEGECDARAALSKVVEGRECEDHRRELWRLAKANQDAGVCEWSAIFGSGERPATPDWV